MGLILTGLCLPEALFLLLFIFYQILLILLMFAPSLMTV